MRTLRKQSGVGLIEVLGALGIGALLMVGLSRMADASIDDLQSQQAAYYQSQVVHAAKRYIEANYDTIKNNTASPSTVLAVSLEQMRAGRFLPAGFADKNAYQQNTCLLIRQPDPANPQGRFDALVVTSGGSAIGEKDLAAASMHAGMGSGYISAREPGVARGASWRMPTDPYRGKVCTGGSTAVLQGNAADAGHLVSNLFYDAASQMRADFLYRDAVPGRPDLNRMTTPLRLGGKALAATGETCAYDSNDVALAMDRSSLTLLTCDGSGKWRSASSWREPVMAWADLPASGSSIGDVRMVKNLSRAFTFNGSAWVALAVDQDGNLDVPGRVKARDLHATNHIESDGGIHAADHIESAKNLIARRNLEVAREAKVGRGLEASIVEASVWMGSPTITLSDRQSPGGRCNYLKWSSYDQKEVLYYPHGTIAMDDATRPLICGTDNRFHYANGRDDINAAR
ncbi:shufflon system plasmid conjugative transfer pilus tip adhesin PilV [Pseudoduganella violacea]|uniref:Bacterial shufflon protein N-terminal domain-containing protein n=1 Tax=Pseudoduganella violacea TaxID=1715466 RepID=A0A7W5BG90_9BURK|nr:shufflon system plasmid conjugative transfer pilus tip adhesin PilV [Pseudoduganella violacea]MBB3122336.1 hypothetical protein [Pseudoduganella violacea]